MKRALAHVLSALVIVALLLSVNPAASEAASSRKINRAVKIAKNQTGDPYVYGATGPNAFDCSGLVYFSYRRAGIKRIPRTSSQQANAGRRIKWTNKRPGDIIVYHNNGNVFHVAVFAGKGRVVEAQKPGTRVKHTRMWRAPRYAVTYRR